MVADHLVLGLVALLVGLSLVVLAVPRPWIVCEPLVRPNLGLSLLRVIILARLLALSKPLPVLAVSSDFLLQLVQLGRGQCPRLDERLQMHVGLGVCRASSAFLPKIGFVDEDEVLEAPVGLILGGTRDIALLFLLVANTWSLRGSVAALWQALLAVSSLELCRVSPADEEGALGKITGPITSQRQGLEPQVLVKIDLEGFEAI